MARALRMKSQQSNRIHRGGVNSNGYLNKTVPTVSFLCLRLEFSHSLLSLNNRSLTMRMRTRRLCGVSVRDFGAVCHHDVFMTYLGSLIQKSSNVWCHTVWEFSEPTDVVLLQGFLDSYTYSHIFVLGGPIIHHVACKLLRNMKSWQYYHTCWLKLVLWVSQYL